MRRDRPARVILLDELADRDGATVIEFRAGDRFVRARPVTPILTEPDPVLDEIWRTPEFQARLDQILAERIEAGGDWLAREWGNRYIPDRPGSPED
jgi:hypothetical protein